MMPPKGGGAGDRLATSGKAIKPVMAPRERPTPARPIGKPTDERKAR